MQVAEKLGLGVGLLVTGLGCLIGTMVFYQGAVKLPSIDKALDAYCLIVALLSILIVHGLYEHKH